MSLKLLLSFVSTTLSDSVLKINKEGIIILFESLVYTNMMTFHDNWFTFKDQILRTLCFKYNVIIVNK